MSAASQTKIFGIRLGIDPKLVIGALVVLAGVLYWFNSRDDRDPTTATGAAPISSATQTGTAVPMTAKTTHGQQRRRGIHDDRGTLKLPAVVPANGDIDPVLRLDLLSRLSKIEPPGNVRNLFESGPANDAAQGLGAVPNRMIPVKQAMVTPPVLPPIAPPPPVQANIPLKYYGFAKPSTAGEANRGFFMDGDDIVVAAEGQLVKQHYLVVQLTPISAKMEDTQLKLGQTLPVTPEALEQGGPAFGRSPANQGMQPGQAMNPGFPNQGEAAEPQ